MKKDRSILAREIGQIIMPPQGVGRHNLRSSARCDSPARANRRIGDHAATRLDQFRRRQVRWKPRPFRPSRTRPIGGPGRPGGRRFVDHSTALRHEVDHIPDMIARSDESDWVDRDNEQNDWESQGDSAPAPILSHRGSNAYDEGSYARYGPGKQESGYSDDHVEKICPQRRGRQDDQRQGNAKPSRKQPARESEIEAPPPRGKGFSAPVIDPAPEFRSRYLFILGRLAAMWRRRTASTGTAPARSYVPSSVRDNVDQLEAFLPRRISEADVERDRPRATQGRRSAARKAAAS